MSNPRFPHTCRIIRPKQTNAMEDENRGTVIYEGSCRSYANYTTNDKGDVISSERKLALPVVQQEWGSLPLDVVLPGKWNYKAYAVPREGDVVVVEKFGYREIGKVIDRMPNNLGTDLLWRYERE